MAHAARRSRHALQSQVGGAGENRGEERGRIGVDAPGAQIGKRVEEPREGVHIPQQIGDPDARHQRIDRAVEAFARRRRERVVRRDFEAALLEPDAVEATGHQLRAHFTQPVVEPLAPACEPGRPVGVQCAVAQDALCVVQGHEIGVESTVVLAACHPDVAGAQPVTQRGDHRRFVDAPLGCGVVSSSNISAASEAIRRREPKSLSRLTGATAPSRANWARLAGWMLSPRWRGSASART